MRAIQREEEEEKVCARGSRDRLLFPGRVFYVDCLEERGGGWRASRQPGGGGGGAPCVYTGGGGRGGAAGTVVRTRLFETCGRLAKHRHMLTVFIKRNSALLHFYNIRRKMFLCPLGFFCFKDSR